MANRPYFSGEKVISHKSGMRSYINPRAYEPTPTEPEKPFQLSPLIIKLSLPLVLLILLVWILFFSPLFAIKQIQIKGQARDETVAAVKTLAGRNIFLIGGRKAEANLERQQPGIKKIKVLRGLPNTVVVDLVERDPALVWQTQDKEYLVDKDGFLFKEGTGNFPKVSDGKNLSITTGERIADSSFIGFITDLANKLPINTKLAVESIKVPETTFQIEVATKNGPMIKLDTSRDIDSQITDINYILEHNKDDSKNLIDVRIAGYAYIK